MAGDFFPWGGAVIRLAEREVLMSFREIVASTLGLHFDEARLDVLSKILSERVKTWRGTAHSYLEKLQSRAGAEELRTLAAALTVSETYFFRNSEQFHAFSELILPQRMAARSDRRKLRILSAGCASGEEAYSVAITLLEAFPDFATWEVEISGFDVNPAMVAKAVAGRYSTWALRATPEEIRRKYFAKERDEWVLSPRVRDMVKFREGNLLARGYSGLESAGEYDIVFCRNVMMYLVPEIMQSVVENLARALAPGGYLLLGHAESLRGLSHEFHLCHTHNTFYYQRRQPASDVIATGRPRLGAKPERGQAPRAEESWRDVIQRASERIEKLAKTNPDERSAEIPLQPRTEAPREDLSVVLQLLGQEKFRDALRLLDKLAPNPQRNPDAQLLRAVLLTNCGEIAAAELVCSRLLAENDLNAGAHYLMALCREHRQDRAGAMEHNRVAVHLDPSFASPHLHLGLLALGAGDLARAREELQQALALLLREDASRILLFGGGFSRKSLLDFCRTQLHACTRTS